MSRLQLSAALSRNPMTAPILSGKVACEGIDLTCTALHPSEMFWRQLRFGEFDVSEMSLSSLVISIAHGERTWTALPIFTTRTFFHTRILVRADAGIEQPSDLAGRRVAVPEYQQTAALWTRGALEHEFGVHPADMIWYMERPVERSHGGATGFQPPTGLDFHYIPTDTSIGEMLAGGAIDATLLYLTDRNLVDRSRADLAADPRVRPLFKDRVAEGIRYYEKTGILPVNHCVVVRSSLLDSHPWVALNLFAAFVRVKDLLREQMEELLAPYRILGALPPGLEEALGLDPLPYGVSGQRHVLDTLMKYSHEQGLSPRLVSVEEVFAPSTLDL